MTKFDKPMPVTDVDLAFGGKVSVLMPAYSAIPAEFRSGHGYWCEFQSKWFFEGLDKNALPTPKEGIDRDAAMRHLAAIQRSYEPKHEHKAAAVAYLASLWFVTP